MAPTLGHHLKQAREKRGLVLADVAHQIKIPVARLNDLEEDIYTTMGGMTYAKSFLRAYAKYLDVDASEVLSQLQTPALGGMEDYKYLVTSLGPWINKRRVAYEDTPKRTSVSQSRTFSMITTIAGVLLLTGVGLLLGNVFFSNKKEPEVTIAKALPAVEPAPPPTTSKKSWTSTEEPVMPVEVSNLNPNAFQNPEAEPSIPPPPKAIAVEDDEPANGKTKRKAR
jgi:cytoskeletal protein RodZ